MKCDQNHWNCCTGKTFCVLVIISLKKKGVQKGQELQWKVNPHSLWKPKKKIISCLKTTWEYFFSWCHEPDRSCLGYTGALWVDLPFFPEATTILTASIVMWSRVNCWGVVIYIFISKILIYQFREYIKRKNCIQDCDISINKSQSSENNIYEIIKVQKIF